MSIMRRSSFERRSPVRSACGTGPRSLAPWLRMRSQWSRNPTIRRMFGAAANSAPTERLGQRSPRRCPRSATTSLAHRSPSISRFRPAGEKIVRFILAWSAPTWNGVGYNWATTSAETRHGLAADVHPHVRQALPQRRRDRPDHRQRPCLTAAADSRVAASGLHRFLAAGLAPRVVGQYPAPDHGRQPLGAGEAADPGLGKGRRRAVCNDRVPEGMPEPRDDLLLVHRQHAAGLFLS